MYISTVAPSLRRFSRSSQSGGATLLFVLIMLLVVSIIGVSAARSTLMQEKMASNTDIRNFVFEAAESALAEGEIRVANTPKIWEIINPDPNAPQKLCVDGVCIPNQKGTPEWISHPQFWTKKDYYKEATAVKRNNLEITPKYMIEDLGQTMAVCDSGHIDITQDPNCAYTSAQRFFRVVGFADDFNTKVMLQSMYLDPNPIRTELQTPGEWTGLPEPPKCNGKPYQAGPGGKKCCPADNLMNLTEYLKEYGKSCLAYCDYSNKDTGYDPDTQECCQDGTIKDKGTCPKFCGTGTSASIIGSDQQCCTNNGSYLWPKDQNCPEICNGQQLPAGQKCCSDTKPYDHSTQMCCDGNVIPKRGNGDPANCPVICNGVELISGQECCAKGTSNEMPWTKGVQSCCNDQVINEPKCPSFCPITGLRYDPTKQKCCNGVPYDTTTGSLKCCNDRKIYDSNSEQCCDEGTTIPVNEYCCKDLQTGIITGTATKADCPDWCGTGPNAKIRPSGHQCCGTYNPWNPATELCCNSQVIPKGNNIDCPAPCGTETYDSGDQTITCCKNTVTGIVIGIYPVRGCPIVCNAPDGSAKNLYGTHGQLGICCTDPRADNYGEMGSCKGTPPSGPGSL